MRCSMAVEVSVGATRPIGVSGAGAGGDGVVSVVAPDADADGSSFGYPWAVSSGKILISRIVRKIKTQSPNHLIKGK